MERRFLTRFVTHYESCAQDVENAILRLGFVVVVFLEREKNTVATLCIFFLITVKSL